VRRQRVRRHTGLCVFPTSAASRVEGAARLGCCLEAGISRGLTRLTTFNADRNSPAGERANEALRDVQQQKEDPGWRARRGPLFASAD
jgi:hypothetical protein